MNAWAPCACRCALGLMLPVDDQKYVTYLNIGVEIHSLRQREGNRSRGGTVKKNMELSRG